MLKGRWETGKQPSLVCPYYTRPVSLELLTIRAQTRIWTSSSTFAARFPVPSELDEPLHPDQTPQPLPHLSYLARLQIFYETSYISPSATTPEPTPVSWFSTPPRNSSMQRNRPDDLLGGSPSIFPPHTPHPIPSAAESDLKYVQSQGTPLVSAIWGESDSRDKEAFALLWDPSDRAWVAIYKMTILVREFSSSLT